MPGSKRGLFYSWFFSYLLILLVPLAVSGLVYVKAGGLMEEEIGKANTALATQLRMEMDGRMSSVNQIFQQLSVNPRVVGAAAVSGQFQPKHRYNLYELAVDLSRYKLIDTYFEDQFIFLNNTRTVINKNGHNDIQLFYDVYINSPDYAFEDFVQTARFAQANTMVQYTATNGEAMIAFACPVTYLEVPNGAATIFVTVKAARMAETLNAMKWNPENIVLIIDQEDHIVSASSGVDIPQFSSYEAFTEGNHTMDGKAYIFSVEESTVRSWKYVVITPTSVFFSRARPLQVYTLIALLCSAVMCTFLAYYFAKRNFNPVKTLISALNRGNGEEQGVKVRDEFQWILHAVDELMAEKESTGRKLYRNTLLLKKNLIHKLLKDLYDHQTIAQEMGEAGLKFTARHYVVVLFATRARGGRLLEAENSEQLNLSGFVAVNCFVNLIGTDYTVESSELDAYTVSIVGLPTDATSHMASLENAAYEAQLEAENQFMVETSIALGGLCQGCERLHVSYRQALEAMEYHTLLGGNEVIVYDNIRNRQKKYFFPMEEEQRIQNAIKAGDSKIATERLRDVLAANSGQAALFADMRQLLHADIASAILKATDDEGESSLLEDIKRLQTAIPMSDFQRVLFDIVERICAFNRQKWEADSRAESLSQDVLDYVDAHYADPNLSISMIGAAFQLTPSYLSKQFKDQTGEGLLATINNVRAEKAKALLQAGASLQEACTQVGYNNVGTLIRVFKKLYGITPGQVKKVL